MKKALFLVVVVAVLLFVYARVRKTPPATAPLPPEVASLPPPPAEDPPLLTAVLSSLRDEPSRARIESELTKGGDPNAVDRGGRPALVHAVRNGDVAVVELLLAKGAKPDVRDRSMGWTPLMWAAFLAGRDPSYVKMAELLLAKGADPNADVNGTTALHVAVNNLATDAKDVRIVETLLRAGAKPDGVPSTDPAKLTASPIVLAAWNGKAAVALALARGGADVASGIRSARDHGHPEIAAALEKLAHPAPAAKKPAPKAKPRR